MKKRIAIVLAAVMVLLAFVAIAAARAEKCDCGGTMRLVGDSEVLDSSYKVQCTHAVAENGSLKLDTVNIYKSLRTWKCTKCDETYSFTLGTREEIICLNSGGPITTLGKNH